VIRPAEEGKLEVSYRWFCTCKDAGEIKKMYIRPKFRGEKLGNLLIEEVIDVSKGNGFSKLYWIQHISCLQQYLFTRNLNLKKQVYGNLIFPLLRECSDFFLRSILLIKHP